MMAGVAEQEYPCFVCDTMTKEYKDVNLPMPPYSGSLPLCEEHWDVAEDGAMFGGMRVPAIGSEDERRS